MNTVLYSNIFLIGTLCVNAMFTCAFVPLQNIAMSNKFYSLSIRHKPAICNYVAKYDSNHFNDAWEYARYIRTNSHPIPIPIMTFDDIFININGIKRVILTSNCDRVIVIYSGKRGVYYMNPNNQEQLSRIRFILSQVNAEISIEHPFNVDNPKHQYYCNPKPTDKADDEYENYIDDFSGGNMDNPTGNFSPEQLFGNEEEFYEDFEDYGFGFGIE